jgi:hypothetical protein
MEGKNVNALQTKFKPAWAPPDGMMIRPGVSNRDVMFSLNKNNL